MDNLTELYCHIDDFYQQFKPEFDAHLIATGRQRLRACQISVAEIMTILVLFHQLRYRQFKSFYYHHMLGMMKREFPNLPSYSRFIELVPPNQRGIILWQIEHLSHLERILDSGVYAYTGTLKRVTAR